MSTVVVLAPMRTELSPIMRRLKLERDRSGRVDVQTWAGRCGAVDVVATVAGVGTARSAEIALALIDGLHPDHVVVAGVAGGLAPDLRVGDVVVPATTRNLDDGTTQRATKLGSREPVGELVTSNEMHGWDVLEAESIAGALAVDMETAAIAAACEGAGVPWSAIRGLSDVVREGTVDSSTLSLVREDGRTDLGGVARYLARHPGKVPSLATMGRDSAKATSAVAEILEQELLARLP